MNEIITREKGFVAIFIALTMPLLIIVLGICLDGGLLLFYDAKLSTATKFAAISATSNYIVQEGQLEIVADEAFVRKALLSNLAEASLVEFKVNSTLKRQCTVKASLTVPLVFMKIFGTESKTLLESYTAERNLGQEMSP